MEYLLNFKSTTAFFKKTERKLGRISCVLSATKKQPVLLFSLFSLVLTRIPKQIEAHALCDCVYVSMCNDVFDFMSVCMLCE